MAKLGSALVGLCAAAALVGCGGSDGTRSDRLGGSDWTLTIVSPAHGDVVPTTAQVEVALSGDAVARGDSPSFDIGFFVDGELVHQTSDSRAQISLPVGSHALGVEGVDRDGQVLDDVLGDEIEIDVDDSLLPDVTPLDIPDNPLRFTPGGEFDAQLPGPQTSEVPIFDVAVEAQPAVL